MNHFQKGLYWVKGYATGNTIYDIQSEIAEFNIENEIVDFNGIVGLGYKVGDYCRYGDNAYSRSKEGDLIYIYEKLCVVDELVGSYIGKLKDFKTGKEVTITDSCHKLDGFCLVEVNFPCKATCILSTPYKESDYYIRIYKAIDTSNKYAYCITSNNKKLTDDNLIGGFISDEIIEPEMVDEKLQPITEKYKSESSPPNMGTSIDEEVERKLESIKDYFSEENVVDIDKMGDSNKPKGYVENINKKKFHVVRNSLPAISPFEEVPDYNTVELNKNKYCGGYLVTIDKKGNTKVNHVPTNPNKKITKINIDKSIARMKEEEDKILKKIYGGR